MIVPQLLSHKDVQELRDHTADLLAGKLPEQTTIMATRDTTRDGGITVQELQRPPEHLSPDEKAQYFLRLHMLHRQLPLHERFLLHPRILDVLEVLIGPDLLALQSMLFIKPPGKPGQGWHQDSYYIPTHPDTLCGAWIAIDDCDEENGAMIFARGSGHEPVYPPCPDQYGFGDTALSDMRFIRGVSDPDDRTNDLATVASAYEHIIAIARAGDVVFFNGHVIHCSRANRSRDRLRRSFVGHYCNARSFTQWGSADEVDASTGMANGSHILARGDTHLPFARPRFGTPCAALMPEYDRRTQGAYAARAIASLKGALLGCAQARPQSDHD